MLACGEADGAGQPVDAGDLGAKPQLDAVVAVPVRGVSGDVLQPLRAREVVLGQRRALIGEVVFGSKEDDLSVETLLP